MKHLTNLALILVLFALPLGSWYYLQQGYNYRKAALKLLTPKSDFPPLARELNSKSLFGDDIVLVCLCEDINALHIALLDDVEDKYDSRGFMVLKLSKEDKIYDSLHEQYSPDKVILVDKDRKIRSSYSFEKDDVKAFVEHIAIVLPFPKKEKVKLKREG